MGAPACRQRHWQLEEAFFSALACPMLRHSFPNRPESPGPRTQSVLSHKAAARQHGPWRVSRPIRTETAEIELLRATSSLLAMNDTRVWRLNKSRIKRHGTISHSRCYTHVCISEQFAGRFRQSRNIPSSSSVLSVSSNNLEGSILRKRS